MTFADFIAAIFWPLVIVFGLSLKAVKAQDVRRWIAWSAIAVGFFYVVLWIVYRDASLVAVVDSNLVLAGFGIGAVWFASRKLYNSPPDPTSQLKAFGMGLVGAHGGIGECDSIYGFCATAHRAAGARPERQNQGIPIPRACCRYRRPDSEGNDAGL
jgi:hypothetical protein